MGFSLEEVIEAIKKTKRNQSSPVSTQKQPITLEIQPLLGQSVQMQALSDVSERVKQQPTLKRDIAPSPSTSTRCFPSITGALTNAFAEMLEANTRLYESSSGIPIQPFRMMRD